MGRKKKEETVVEEVKPAEKSAKKASAKKETIKAVKTLDQIKAELLKKAKATNTIEQAAIFEAINHYDLDDDDMEEMIAFFEDNGIEILYGDDEDEDEDDASIDEIESDDVSLDEDPDESFLLDDDEDMLLGQKYHFIQTSVYSGLTPDDIEKAVNIFTFLVTIKDLIYVIQYIFLFFRPIF